MISVETIEKVFDCLKRSGFDLPDSFSNDDIEKIILSVIECIDFGLVQYIDEHFEGNQRAFAAAQGVQPPQVTQWIQKDFIVVNGQLYSPRRELKT
jgi:hypothetical protein